MAVLSLFLTFLTVVAGLLLSIIIYRLFLHQLSRVPGPLLCRLTALWTFYHTYRGDSSSQIDALHKRYGPIVRIAPNEVSIADGAALAPIYVEKGGFLKAPCYQNFDIGGHATIFSARDPAVRAVRSKAVVAMFSSTSLREGKGIVDGCVERLVERLQVEARESRQRDSQPVDLLNLTRTFALDVVSSYLFGRAFQGQVEQGGKLAASAFVDAVVTAGRFFYLPNWTFKGLETLQEKVWPEAEVKESAERISEFVESLMNGCEKSTDSTYQARLSRAGISRDEVKIQCEDLVFAGTDTTGTTLSTICWRLAKHPDVYRRLKEEVSHADAQDANHNPQAIPYLDAVVREGLRLAMVNPERFPRIVPDGGYRYTSLNGKEYFLPSGTQVGIQPYSLHLNGEVYHDPSTFRPERWLDDPSLDMSRDWIPFGVGSRQCIARNLAMVELFHAVRAIARCGVLDGAEAMGERIEIVEWFNSRVKGERIELVWR